MPINIYPFQDFQYFCIIGQYVCIIVLNCGHVSFNFNFQRFPSIFWHCLCLMAIPVVLLFRILQYFLSMVNTFAFLGLNCLRATYEFKCLFGISVRFREVHMSMMPYSNSSHVFILIRKHSLQAPESNVLNLSDMFVRNWLRTHGQQFTI